MGNSGVADVHLGRTNLAFAQILKPRWQLTHKQGVAEEIEVAAHGVFADPQRTRRVGTVPGLGVEVAHHRQEAVQRGCWQTHVKAEKVSLDESSHIVCQPSLAGCLVGLGEKRAWKTPA